MKKYIYELAAVIGGAIIGQISAKHLLRQLRRQEEEELKAVMREEQATGLIKTFNQEDRAR